ncbi:MAG: hypothetical protein HKN48_00210 [Flavobacteriaceae bacterium]|nr:hypothetical protein [Flavobacteriaceae bacterium]
MKKLICKIKGHSFIPVKKSVAPIKEYTCSCCKQRYTEDGYGQIVRLTKYWEMNNLLFEKHFQNQQAV